MDIKSLHFVLFLPIVVFVYYLSPQRFKWLVLLTSSTIFIAFNSLTSLLILITAIVINFLTAQGINKIENPKPKQYFLWLVIVINLILLGVFKYYNAINRGSDFFSSILQIDNPIAHVEWLLPLGISYYIFQSIGYNIEIYRGKELPEKHLGYFSVYLSFFPKLIAGPIERSFDFLPQLRNKIKLKYENISHGCRLIIWGLFKKMVIAEHINEFIQPIFDQSEAYSGLPLLMAFLLYTVEIYADFSGYTDIALGGARLFGFKLTNNFNRPFFASSLTEFWRRWHISLSTWVNDYIFMPLSMWISIRFNFKKWGIIFSVFFSFLLLGIWHGSDWTFAIFGAIQGIVLAYEILTQKMRKKLSELIPALPYKMISISLTLIVFAFSCVYFRADGIYEAQQWVANSVKLQSNLNFFITPAFIITILTVLLLVLFDHKLFSKGFENWCETKPIYVRWGIYILLIFSIITLSGVNTYPFIYSNF
jgi:D-alanyl-lipoteichoic acid acyltransferase DltB (MBOAT superfamily)